MTAHAAPAIVTSGLTKRFGSTLAVDDVDLEVPRGSVYGFLGPNGSGKTTTISMILGLTHPTAGTVHVLGNRVTPGRPQALRAVGALVGATPAFVPYLSARRNLQLDARLHAGVTPNRIDEVLELVELTPAADRKVRGYSTGMKQRLGIAAAVLHRPELLILDEPTNGLDPAGTRDMRDLIGRLAEGGITILVASHLLHEIELMCDRVAVMNRGRVVTQGRVADLLVDGDTVRVRGRDIHAMAVALNRMPGARAVVPSVEHLDVHGVRGDAVISHLVGAGIVPEEVIRVRRDLESVFLSVTGPDAAGRSRPDVPEHLHAVAPAALASASLSTTRVGEPS